MDQKNEIEKEKKKISCWKSHQTESICGPGLWHQRASRLVWCFSHFFSGVEVTSYRKSVASTDVNLRLGDLTCKNPCFMCIERSHDTINRTHVSLACVCRMEFDILIDKNDQSKIENAKNTNRKYGNSSLNLWCHRYVYEFEWSSHKHQSTNRNFFIRQWKKFWGPDRIHWNSLFIDGFALSLYKDSRIVIESFHRIRPMSNDKNSAYDDNVCLLSGFTAFGNRRKSVRSNTTHACEFMCVYVYQSIRDAYTTFWITYYVGNYRKCLTVYLFTHFDALSFSLYVCVLGENIMRMRLGLRAQKPMNKRRAM